MAAPNDVAKAFVDHLVGRYAAADAAGLGGLYGDDSMWSYDGQTANGRAMISGGLAGRVAGGPVHIRIVSQDAQAAPGGYLVGLISGDSTVPAGKFAEAVTLFPIAGGGMYVKNDMLRFGPGSQPFNMSADASGMGASFVQQYYQVYSTNRAGLGGVYRENSVHTFEGRTNVGPAAIMLGILGSTADPEKPVKGMPEGSIEPATIDVHPVAADSVLVMVTGKFTITGEANPLNFAQLFHIVNAGGSPYISNEIFRFNYG